MIISKEQLAQVISSGDDSVDSKLVLEQNGLFKIIPLSEFSFDDSYVTSWGIYKAGNEYVGVEAAADEYHLNKIMWWAEIAWKKFQITGQLNIANITT